VVRLQAKLSKHDILRGLIIDDRIEYVFQMTTQLNLHSSVQCSVCIVEMRWEIKIGCKLWSRALAPLNMCHLTSGDMPTLFSQHCPLSM
jgi:hypothetical protein